MLNVLLVDDEYLELDLLQDNVDWECYGYRVCGTAKNGKDAITAIEKCNPDVVITDIKMPVMDGVALSRYLHVHHPNISIVFLSGYDQFDYLKNAFSVNAVDYLLKPIDLEEIPPLLVKISEMRNKSLLNKSVSRSRVAQILQQLDTNRPFEPAFMEQAARVAFDIHNAALAFSLVLASISEAAYLSELGEDGMGCIQTCHDRIQAAASTIHAIVIPLQGNSFCLLSTIPPQDPRFQDAFSYQQPWLDVCIWFEPVQAGQLPATLSALRQTQVQAQQYLGTGYVCIAPQVFLEPQLPEKPEFSQLLHFLHHRDSQAMHNWLNEYFHCLPSTSSEYHVLAVQLTDILYHEVAELSELSLQPTFSKSHLLGMLLKANSRITLQLIFDEFLSRLLEYVQNQTVNPIQLSVKKITEYIDEFYYEQLSIDEIAYKFGFSANYLSTIFKKHLGCTVLEYITDKRLTQAAYFLENTPRRITQISQEVGYRNPSYFCSLFAKKYGITPKQFRGRKQS